MEPLPRLLVHGPAVVCILGLAGAALAIAWLQWALRGLLRRDARDPAEPD